jgi:hypothetical protein
MATTLQSSPLSFCYLQSFDMPRCGLVPQFLSVPLYFIVVSTLSDISSMLTLPGVSVMSKHPLGNVEDRKWAWNSSSCTNSDDCLPEMSTNTSTFELRTHQVPPRDHRHQPKATSNLEVIHCMLQYCDSWVIFQVIMPSSQEAETEDQTEEHDNKRNVDSQRSTQKDKGNQGHYNIIMPLNCIIQLRQSARLSPRRIRRNNSMKSVVHVTEIHPVAAVDYEYGHRE